MNGAPAPYEVRDEHIVLTNGVPVGPVIVEIEFMAGDGSLNWQEDFLYTLFVPDRARVAFPVFDTTNPQSSFPAVSGSSGGVDSRCEWVDRVTDCPRPSRDVHLHRDRSDQYLLFSFAAGRFEVEEAERAGSSDGDVSPGNG